MNKDWTKEDNFEEFGKCSERRERERLVSKLVGWGYTIGVVSNFNYRYPEPGAGYLEFKKTNKLGNELKSLVAKELDKFFDARYHAL